MINFTHKNILICKGMILSVLFIISSISVIPVQGNISVISDGNTLYVGGDGPGNYTRIQDAIDNASSGDTIYVYSGVYYEVVVISKQLNLIGDEYETTIIDAQQNGYTVYATAGNVTISGFTIQNGSYTGHELNWANLFLDNDYNIITGNIFRDSESGILMSSSDGNTITGNTMEYNDHGIWLITSHNNEISQNIITNNSFMGINIGDSDNNIITSNIIDNNNEFGIYLIRSCDNKITENEISNNSKGIYLTSWDGYGVIQGNVISKNNFKNNTDTDAYFMIGRGIHKRNIWQENYWGQSRVLPKIILGLKWIYYQWLLVPMFQVDWHPANEPYEILA